MVAGALALGGAGLAAVAFLGGDEVGRPMAGPSPSPTTSQPPEETGSVACDGEVPRLTDKKKPQYDEPPEMQIDEGAAYTALLDTSCGEIEIELFAKETPITVNSFVFLAREGFFDGLTFHRVIPGFVAQGGDPEGTGSGGPGYQFDDEIVKSLIFDQPGLLAMANSGPGTNGSQFFITFGPAEHLNGLHTIFGRVTKGMEVVTQIEGFGTPEGAPNSTIYIEKVTIEGP